MYECSYNDLIEYLGQHREIEFYYNNNKYSISWGDDYNCYLTKFGDADNEQGFKTQFELLDKCLVDQKHLKDIWQNVKIDMIF